MRPARAAAVVGEVADSLRSLAREKGLKFTTSFSDSNDEFVVVTDRRALHQILLNLANNAVKCTEKGSIAIDVVAVGRGKPHVALNVTDTGIGIKPEDRPRLFQAFGQVDPSSTRRFEGAGLGLHLCARLAMLIGASLTFESAHGQGSTFTLTLPRGSR
ncbi:MAG: ATP-binding protein [Candidatus Tumulicola sp.]